MNSGAARPVVIPGECTAQDQRLRRPSRQIRVLHHLWSGEIGGAERAVSLLVEEQIRDPRLTPAILFAQACGAFWTRCQELECPVRTLNLQHGHALFRLRAMTKAIQDFDIHHFHSAEPLLMLASVMCDNVCRVYTHRGGLIDYPPAARVRYEMTGLLLRHYFHAFSGNTGHGARSGAKLYRLPSHRFSVTYNGLDFNAMEPTRPANAVREELGLRPDAWVLATAANLKPWKRIERLIDAVGSLSDPRVCLLVIGDGVDRRRLEEHASRLGVSSSVFFTGFREPVWDYIAAADVFCLPSVGLESFGNAAVEAMALGIPTIVFADGGGTLEHIVHRQTGFIVSDQHELEATLRTLLLDSGLGQRVGWQGRIRVRERYTPDRSAKAYWHLYQEGLRAAGIASWSAE